MNTRFAEYQLVTGIFFLKLKLTVLTPENQWLEDEFPFWDDLVSGAKNVCFREL